MRAFLVSTCMVAALCGCAAPGRISCLGGGDLKTAELVFARVSPQAPGVSERDFARFVDQEVSPRFPDGLTIIDAQGRWTPPAGSLIHDPSKMVMIVLRGRSDDQVRLQAIRAAYEHRYHQPTVLLANAPGCVSL